MGQWSQKSGDYLRRSGKLIHLQSDWAKNIIFWLLWFLLRRWLFTLLFLLWRHQSLFCLILHPSFSFVFSSFALISWLCFSLWLLWLGSRRDFLNVIWSLPSNLYYCPLYLCKLYCCQGIWSLWCWFFEMCWDLCYGWVECGFPVNTAEVEKMCVLYLLDI